MQPLRSNPTGRSTAHDRARPDMRKDESPGDALSHRLVILLSHERSGSHYLAEMLASGGEIVSFDEVCNFDAVDPDRYEASFFGFRRQWQEAHPDLAVRPNADVMNDFLDGYFSRLLHIEPVRKVLVDVKYGHVHNFETGWWPSEHRPFLVKFLDRRKVRVVHLTRGDSIAAVVSGLAANKAGIWHRRAGAASAKPAAMRVPAPNVVHMALALQREKENFFAWLAGNRCFNLAYEEICEADAVKERALARLCAFLEIGTSDFSSTLEKMMPPVRELVENYSELRRVAAIFGLPGPRTGM
jgi:LPS sulfotransferase NodH